MLTPLEDGDLLKLSRNSSERRRRLKEWNVMGMKQIQTGFLREAADNFNKSIRYLVSGDCFASEKDRNNLFMESYYGLGLTYHLKNDLDKSLECMLKALKLCSNGSCQNKANLYSALAQIYASAAMPEKSLHYSSKSSAMFEELVLECNERCRKLQKMIEDVPPPSRLIGHPCKKDKFGIELKKESSKIGQLNFLLIRGLKQKALSEYNIGNASQCLETLSTAYIFASSPAVGILGESLKLSLRSCTQAVQKRVLQSRGGVSKTHKTILSWDAFLKMTDTVASAASLSRKSSTTTLSSLRNSKLLDTNNEHVIDFTMPVESSVLKAQDLHNSLIIKENTTDMKQSSNSSSKCTEKNYFVFNHLISNDDVQESKIHEVVNIISDSKEKKIKREEIIFLKEKIDKNENFDNETLKEAMKVKQLGLTKDDLENPHNIEIFNERKPQHIHVGGQPLSAIVEGSTPLTTASTRDLPVIHHSF